MTRLLISVRNANEARAALRGGADLIDVKEPALGSLGAASKAVWDEVRQEVHSRCLLSTAMGELVDSPAHRCGETIGFNFAKVGLANCSQRVDWRARWQAVVDLLPMSVVPVAVAYADYEAANAPDPEVVFEMALRLECGALLFDTWSKNRGNLLQVLSNETLGRICERAKNRGLLVVLAGSMSLDSLPDALQFRPDVIAVRGAVCSGDRTGELQEDLVRHFSTTLRALVAKRDSVISLPVA